MSDPYLRGAFKSSPYGSKREITGTVVAVLRGQLDGRGLELIKPISRALLRGEIHEFIVTREPSAGPGSRVDSIGYLFFFEVESGGVAVAGDRVSCAGASWTLAGFDLTHAPNHLNVVLRGEDRRSGEELGIVVGDKVSIVATE